MKKYIKALEGIRYCDWIKLKIAIDREFEQQKSELEKSIKLASSDKICEIIQSQFG